MRTPLRLLIVAVLVLTAFPAAEAVSFRATLDSIRLTARPGEVQTREFRLTLDPGQPKTRFRAHMQDWWRSEDGKQSFYRDPGTLSRSCGLWVTLNPVESEISAGETMTVRLTVSVPPDLKPGGYWCVLTVDEIPDPLALPEGIGVQFLASVSVGMFVYVGELERAADITAIDVRDDSAVVFLRNDGNTPVAIEGRFEFVRPGAADPTAVVTLARGTLLTEPIATGMFAASLPGEDVLPSGRYVVRAIIDYGVDHYIGLEREIDVLRDVPLIAGHE